MLSRKGRDVARGAATMVQENLTADVRRGRRTGSVGAYPSCRDLSAPRPGLRPDYRLDALAGTAAWRKADTVSAGEGS